jgi:hypothetical protein
VLQRAGIRRVIIVVVLRKRSARSVAADGVVKSGSGSDPLPLLGKLAIELEREPESELRQPLFRLTGVTGVSRRLTESRL